MSEERFYLKQNVQIEPLFNGWYAWPHLITPATAAMNIANLHVKIMKSYVMAPEIHAAAVRNPAMRGGPFLDFDSRRVNEIKELLNATLDEQAHMIEFAEAVKQTNNMLMVEAKAHSLEQLYGRVPGILRGYCELVYDLNHQPSIRFIEGLLYQSPFYNPSLQSIALSLVESDDRPFVFSTPRMKENGSLYVNIPFAHEGIDELFRMRTEPQTFARVKQSLGLTDKDDSLFSSFLTKEQPRTSPSYDGDSVRIRYMGHACVLVETKGVSIMTDPVISYDYLNDTRRYTYADLPDTIDYVLLTHTHSDHVVFETLLQLRHKIRNIIVPKAGGGFLEDPSLKLLLQNIGFKNVFEIDELESIPVEGGSITGLPFFGEHGDLSIRSKIAYLIRLNEKSIMCAADSNNLEPKVYEHTRRITGDVDILFVGMECDGAPLSWMYGPLLMKPLDRKMDSSRRLSGSDYERALEMVHCFNCKQVYVYAMGQEPWLNFITSISYTDESRPIVESNKLVNACRERGLASERLFGTKELFL
jgi:L-ascorbate metabolism protein UlaG (beta-lactamase superfamily)